MAQAVHYSAEARAYNAGEGFIARLRKSYDDYRLYRATVNELSQLSDRDLADLGISRYDIVAIGRESVYGA